MSIEPLKHIQLMPGRMQPMPMRHWFAVTHSFCFSSSFSNLHNESGSLNLQILTATTSTANHVPHVNMVDNNAAMHMAAAHA